MRERWAGVPRGVRLTVAAAVAVFAYGTAVHVGQLIAGRGDPYPWAPGWLAAYFISLTAFDALAGALLALRRPAGPAVGAAVLVTDAAANGYAAYVLEVGGTAARVSQAVITVLAVAFLVAAVRIRRWF